jgi:hypothetical protein
MANYSDLPFSSYMHRAKNVPNDTTDFDDIRELVCFISGTRKRHVKCGTVKILVLHQTLKYHMSQFLARHVSNKFMTAIN